MKSTRKIQAEKNKNIIFCIYELYLQEGCKRHQVAAKIMKLTSLSRRTVFYCLQDKEFRPDFKMAIKDLDDLWFAWEENKEIYDSLKVGAHQFPINNSEKNWCILKRLFEKVQ